MAFYNLKSDPVTNRAKLFKLVQDAEAQLATATVDVNALGGADDATVEKANEKVRGKEALLTSRLLHLETADIEIKADKAERDEAADQKQRSATAIDCHKLVEALVAEGDVMARSAAKMSGIAAKIIPIAPEANGLKTFSDVCVAQIPEAVDLLSRLIREHAAAVLRREAPAALKQPAAPFVPAVIAKPVRMPLFAMRPIKHTDPDSGVLIVTQKFADVEMPPTFAKVALDHKVCVRIGDPLRKQHHGTTPGHANAELAFDLDAAMSEPNATPADPILASPAPTSPFKVVDRGPAIQMKVAR